MPVILPVDSYAAWLGETDTSPDALQAMLKPYPAELMAAWTVSPAVGNVKNNHAGLMEEINSA
jgi:putative SOS response-associated peptidase YedK